MHFVKKERVITIIYIKRSSYYEYSKFKWYSTVAVAVNDDEIDKISRY